MLSRRHEQRRREQRDGRAQGIAAPPLAVELLGQRPLRREGAQLGAVTVTLFWEGRHDLDVIVKPPGVEELSHRNREAKNKKKKGGGVAPTSGAARTRSTATQVLGSCPADRQAMPTHC